MQYWLPASPPEPPKTASASPAPTVRQIPSGSPQPASPAPSKPEPVVKPEPVKPEAIKPEPVKPQPVPGAPVEMPSDALAVPTPPPAAAPEGKQEVRQAEATEGPPAVALVDLNTATLAELNALKGAGNIGRAIIAKRPYAQVGDLLTKRVVSRSLYTRIKEQVTVR